MAGRKRERQEGPRRRERDVSWRGEQETKEGGKQEAKGGGKKIRTLDSIGAINLKNKQRILRGKSHGEQKFLLENRIEVSTDYARLHVHGCRPVGKFHLGRDQVQK
jgi:hypothetical protein